MTTNATPTLLLRGIDVKSVLDNYLSSLYATEDIAPKRKVDIKKLNMEQDTVMGNTNINGIYEIKDGNLLTRVYTTNSKLFEAYMDKQKGNDGPYLNKKIPCVYCRRNLSDDFLLSIITTVSNLNNEELTVYYGYDAVCSLKEGGLRCAYTHLCNEIKKEPQNNFLMNALTNLKNLSYFVTGELNIVPLPDWRLLDSNGGSMDPKTFFSITKLEFNPNIVFIPGKFQWSKKL